MEVEEPTLYRIDYLDGSVDIISHLLDSRVLVPVEPDIEAMMAEFDRRRCLCDDPCLSRDDMRALWRAGIGGDDVGAE